VSVIIQPLVGQSISDLIFESTGIRLSLNESGILEFCQNMSSETWTGFAGGKLICCWGLIPPSLLSDQAYLWMHSTPAVKDHTFVLVRHSQRIIEDALKKYPRIVGHCKVGATDSIRWLRWLGARFMEMEGPFIPFEIIRKQTDKQVVNG
jgi:hypothetical protein